MPTTRSKAQSASGNDAATGSKHQLADKKEEKPIKKQKTLEETVENGKGNKSKNRDDTKQKQTEQDDEPESSPKKKDDKPKAKTTPKKSKSEPKKKVEGEESNKEHKQVGEATTESKSEDKPQPDSSGDTKSSSSILEKGIIYFFLRGRVNTESPSSVSEIARTYFVLRPASTSNKPTDNHSRLLAVPKKTFPKTGRERWISFVEKTGVSFSDLKENFLGGNEYETKTRGTQHTPPVKPEGEGVYAITSTGRESHLCYILTRPDDLGEVQRELGLKDKGSWVITTRNPEYPPPGGVGRLPEGPEFPAEIKKDFHTLRWAPTKPNHLDVEGAQILLVGESSGIEKATEAPKDKGDGEADPREELEELAEEDEKRMRALSQDDSEAIFKDLQASAKDYPDMQKEF